MPTNYVVVIDGVNFIRPKVGSSAPFTNNFYKARFFKTKEAAAKLADRHLNSQVLKVIGFPTLTSATD